MNMLSRFLVMAVGGDRYALPFGQVTEVTEMRPLSPIPRAPAWCLGATRSHGTVVAVVDLAAYLDGEPEPDPQKLVVLDLHTGSLAVQVGPVTTLVTESQDCVHQDQRGRWLETEQGPAVLLESHELVHEVAAAMAR